MATPRKALPIAARAAVRDALDAATTAASLIRQVRRAQTRATAGDGQLADALERLGYAQSRLGEAIGGSMADEEDKGRPVPFVGRTVHYVAYGTPGGEYAAGAHRAAIVTEVHNPGEPESVLSLCVLNPIGMHFQIGVYYDATGQTPGTWHGLEFVPNAPALPAEE